VEQTQAYEKLRPQNTSLPVIDAGFKKATVISRKIGFTNSLASNDTLVKFLGSKQSLEGINTNAETAASNIGLTHRSMITSAQGLFNSVQKLNILDTHGSEC
jgi:hypothetical protein